MSAPIKPHPRGYLLMIKATPKSSRSAIAGWEADSLKVRVAAAPEKGAANLALLKFLANTFDIPVSQLELLSGETSRHKRLLICGLTLQQIQEKLPPYSA